MKISINESIKKLYKYVSFNKIDNKIMVNHMIICQMMITQLQKHSL